jgi:hypothetical protein
MIHCGWKGSKTGHIWNWELDANGKLVFYDAQTGEIIGQDSKYWSDLSNSRVGISRLDDKPLAPDIEVMLAPIDVRDGLTEQRATGERVVELRSEKSRLGRETNAFEAVYKKAIRDYGYNHPKTQEVRAEYNASYARWMTAGIALEDIFKTPEGKALYNASVVNFPELPKERVRM